MLRRSFRFLRRAPTGAVRTSLTPLEALTQIQLGMSPSLMVQRGFMLEHCESQLERRGITEAKLIAMDPRLCGDLLKQLVLEQYLSVPFRVFSFDMEFTGPPVFTADGPTEDITEVGLYSPLRDETFSSLVQPTCGRKQGPGVADLTHITDEMLAEDGVPFVEAWEQFLNFVHTPQPDELPGAEERILLLSHGGKLADVSLIKWTLEKCGLELPSSFVFGDTIHLIRDAHRRRPVTVDKHPPSWKLGDLVQWLHIPPTLPAHRAGNDARMTWDALYHTLLRYGDYEMTPREQLIPRFFDEEAKRRMRKASAQHVRSRDLLTLSDNFVLADAALVSSSPFGGEESLEDDDVSVEAYQDSSMESGIHTRSTAKASADLMDLDFDDIFNEQSQVGARSTTPSLKNERRTNKNTPTEDVGVAEEDASNDVVDAGDATPSTTRAQRQTRRNRKAKVPPASDGVEQVFLV